MVSTEISLENKLRQKAKRQGLTLKKSRTAQSLDNHGGFMIVDSNNNIVSGDKFDMAIEDIQKYLQ
jgi:hypothetical protein